MPHYVPPCLGLREIRHVRVDHAWRDCVYANAPWPENGSPVFHKVFYCSLGCRVGKDRRLVQIGCVPTTARAPSDEITTMFEPSPRMGRSCCTRKNGLRTFVAKRLSNSSAV